MTEAADAKPEPGWYVVTEEGAQPGCIYRYSGGFYLLPERPVELPPGWTLGPSIADLLRDAARLREENNRLRETLARLSNFEAREKAHRILAEFALLAQSPKRIREFAESEEMSRLILDCARVVHSSALPIETIVSAYLAALFREAGVSGGGSAK